MKLRREQGAHLLPTPAGRAGTVRRVLRGGTCFWYSVVGVLVACQLVAAYIYFFSAPSLHPVKSPPHVPPLLTETQTRAHSQTWAARAPPGRVVEPSVADASGLGPQAGEGDQLHPHLDVGDERYVTPHSLPERLQPKRINECSKGEAIGMCAQDPRIAYAAEFVYPTWVIPMPKFIRKEHETLFFELQQVQGYMKQHDSRDCQNTNCRGVDFPPSERLVFHGEQFTYGHVVSVSNGLYAGRPSSAFSGPYECEWPASYTMLYPPANQVLKPRYEKVAVFVGPQYKSFQHFIDRLMPDIAQAWDLVSTDYSWLIASQPAGTDTRGEIWQHLFGRHGRVWPSENGTVSAEQMLYTCRVPRFHPWIWQRMRDMLGVVHVPIQQRTKIVYLPRGRTRKVLNEEALVTAMRAFVASRGVPGEELVVFNHKEFPGFLATRDFFNHQVKAVIGPHGGAFYNINFSPRDTLVVEFFPVKPYVKTALRWPEGTWWQAACLQHNYYMIPIESPDGRGDVTVNVPEIIDILRKELPLPSTTDVKARADLR